MCEILGFSSKNKMNIHSYLQEFFSHSTTNPNGWGLAEFCGDNVIFHTEPLSANASTLLPGLLENDTESENVLAHIRKATVGGISPKNCHPFVLKDNSNRTWYLMHNGTIFNGLELLQYKSKQNGDTDSERILLYLIDQINAETMKKNCCLNPFERFKVVERTIEKLSYRNKLNLIIYDEYQMYVHVNMKDTLFFKNNENGILFATVPLEDEGWEPLPLTTLFVYRNGKLQYRGKNHHNAYIDIINHFEPQYDYNI